jgi:Sulfotransferase domain
MRKPNFFFVGAPKSGTTAMAQYLALRPDIFMARKEMHTFGEDLHFGPQFYRRKLDAYLAEFEDWGDQPRAGEASVWYLYSKTAAAEIKAFNPDAQIIIMLRDPVEMLHSMYYAFRWDGNEHLPTFEAALAAESQRRAGLMTTRQTYFAQGLVYHEIVRFTEQVRRYFRLFGRERVHVVIYDDFAVDVAGTYRRALDFLGVNSTRIETEFEPVNANKFVKSSALRNFLSDPLVRSTLVAIRPMLPKMVFRMMQNVDARLRKLNSRDGVRPPMSPEVRERLNFDFAPEVAHLSELLGRDLTHWSRGCSATRKANKSEPAREAAPAPVTIASPTACAGAVQNLSLPAGEMRLDAYS